MKDTCDEEAQVKWKPKLSRNHKALIALWASMFIACLYYLI